MSAPQRLSRRVTVLTGCSRREADLAIEGGWVQVDGRVEERPQFPVGEETIWVDPQAVLTPPQPATLLLHKPAGLDIDAARALITPHSRSDRDGSGVRLLQRHFSHLSSVLALPDSASGLAVFTQDGRLQARMEREGHRIEQELLVDVDGTLAPNGLALLNHGLTFNGYAMPPIKVSWQSEQRLRFAIRRLQPSQIEPMCQAVGLRVLAIKRLRIGRLGLSRMEAGHWRNAAPDERF